MVHCSSFFFLSWWLQLLSCRAVLVADEYPLVLGGGTEGSCDLGDAPWDSTISIGASGKDWLPVAIEIELYSRTPDKSMEDIRERIETKFKAIEHSGDCPERMFKVSTDSAAIKTGWIFELESPQPGTNAMWEITTPVNLTQQETEIVCLQTHKLTKDFSKADDSGFARPERRPGLHVHVGSKCLLEDERKLVALLLVWDKYYEALLTLTQSQLHKKEHKFANTIREKSPNLYDQIWQEYLTAEGFTPEQGHKGTHLTKIFQDFETATSAGRDDHDGFRRYIVNVCHLLNVKCAHNYPEKNKVPKFGALEFRGFDAALGELVRFIVMIAERTVQNFCQKDLSDIHELLMDNVDGDKVTKAATNATALLAFIGLKNEGDSLSSLVELDM